jgi:hypothetical protein
MTAYVNGSVVTDRNDFNPLAPLLSVLRKFEGWQYEQEWRLIRFNPWPKPDYTQKMPKPTRVMLGYRMDEDAAKEIAAICAKRHIEVWKMSLAPDKFELIAEPYIPIDN